MPGTPFKWNTTAVAFAGTWATLTSANGRATGTYATWTSSTSAASATIELAGFGLQAFVPSAAVITRVRVSVDHGVQSTTNVPTSTGRVYSGTTALGPGTVALTPGNNAIVNNSFDVTATLPTHAQLADLRIRLAYTRAAVTTAATVWVDRVGVEVNFTWADTNYSIVVGTDVYAQENQGPAPATSAAGNHTFSFSFWVESRSKYLKAYRFLQPDDGLVGGTPTGQLWDVETKTVVAGSTLPFGPTSGESPGGWVERWLPTPVLLTPGVQYRLAVHMPVNITLSAVAPVAVTHNFLKADPDSHPAWAAGGPDIFPGGLVGALQTYWVDGVIGDLPAAEQGGMLMLMAE
jgi:hypothetical protein